MSTRLKYIIVDDDPFNNMICTMVIKDSLGEETEVKAFTKPEEGLLFIKENVQETTVLFLDINMPGINGFELLDKIREMPDLHNRKGNMKVFMLTSSINPDDYKLATEKYNDIITGFRIKPLTDTIFLKIVQTYF